MAGAVAGGAVAAAPADQRTRFLDGRRALVAQFMASRRSAPAAVQLLRALGRHVDAALTRLWQQAGLPTDAALVAVGGYGRGELFPYSDVDVLVLLPEHPDAAVRGAAERFVTACWDHGVEIGSSVRTTTECLEESARDVTVQTALLESRRVCGAATLFHTLVERHAGALDARAFLRAKLLEMQQRHVRHEGTPYALEPNCKESPGGLRDLQVLIWAARGARLGRTWAELAANGLLTAFEAGQLERHEGTLKLIRARLHAVAGRREDRLVFDLQTAVAESMGYRATPAQRSSEVLMHRYYWAAKAVTQLNQILLLGIEERVDGSGDAPMRPLNERFLDRGGLLEIAHDRLYVEQPHAILETFLLFTSTPGVHGLSARTLRALYNARDAMDPAFRRDPLNRARFLEILRQPRGITHALRLMNHTSVLGRYLWVFRRIVGRMQHDLFHVYTVDQHILMVVRNVRRFFLPEHAHEYPFCSQIAAQWERPWVLYVAAIFHDVAKGRGGDHSELGADEARRFCADHGIDGKDAGLIEFLVRHHLTMSRIAQKQDLADPDVVAAFARTVGTPRALAALYLLTVADIRGTSPKVWNAWKGKLLEDLFRATLRALGGPAPSRDAAIEARKHDARRILALHAALPGTEAELWQTVEVSYFLRHDAADIAWHARSLWPHVRSEAPVVRARASSAGAGLQVLVYLRDQPDLFARICGYFDSAGFGVLDAKIHTTRAGYALDTFQVVAVHALSGDTRWSGGGGGAVDAGGAGGLDDVGGDEAPDLQYRDLISLVETQLAQTLARAGPLPEPRSARVSRRVRSFPLSPRVTLVPDEGGQRWLLTVSASDRWGLLYALARVLARHRVNLQLAKITTLGERIEDTFLIDGPELQRPKAQLRIESELLDAVGTV